MGQEHRHYNHRRHITKGLRELTFHNAKFRGEVSPE